jgi:hypothetical protein
MIGEYVRSLGLGALPAAAANDPILASASRTAREILATVEQYPARDRGRVLASILEAESPGLPGRVARTALKLRWKRQVTKEDALYHALRLAFADETLDHLVKEGERQLRGWGAATTATAGIGLAGKAGKRFGSFLGRTLRGAVCAEGSEDFASQLASRRGERAAAGADLGGRATRGLVDCEGELPPGEELPPERPTIPVLPLVLGGAALLGLVTLVVVLRK